ncbi:MAG: hypothetical protein K6B69_00415 [Lachnospiraceae bacterium]|nr:hypothetical protein [Lachnospiraceae bacterium]
MKNERNAGRKGRLTQAQVEELNSRWKAGESVAELAEECGISRQALYKRFQDAEYVPARIDYSVEGELCTRIEVDFRKEQIHIVNYVTELSKRAFGYEEHPDWDAFVDFLERYYLKVSGIKEKQIPLLSERGGQYSLADLEGVYDGRSLQIRLGSDENIPVFRFSKGDLMYYRSDTDGYQLKGITADRRYFVKAQAVMAGVKLRDWAVEIIATGLCKQFGIPCVEQKQGRVVYGKTEYDAVYSANFELDGYSFAAFENLLERCNRSSKEEEFIRMDAVSKLKWCAEQLAEIGSISYERAEKYMLDLAVLDCLVGNVDRHTRNFGLFFRNDRKCFELPLVFDNGMGLFEHDYYRDRYESFDEAMRTVYVSPYGEDPFELMEILDKEFHLKKKYPGIVEPDYGDALTTPFVLEYEKRMCELWQRFD